MRRHETDAVSLVAGLLFLAVAVVHIAARSTNTELSLRWMVPAVLVLLGVVGLLGALRGPRRTAAEAAAPGDRLGAADDAEPTDVVEPASPDGADEASTGR